MTPRIYSKPANRSASPRDPTAGHPWSLAGEMLVFPGGIQVGVKFGAKLCTCRLLVMGGRCSGWVGAAASNLRFRCNRPIQCTMCTCGTTILLYPKLPCIYYRGIIEFLCIFAGFWRVMPQILYLLVATCYRRIFDRKSRI